MAKDEIKEREANEITDLLDFIRAHLNGCDSYTTSLEQDTITAKQREIGGPTIKEDGPWTFKLSIEGK